MEFPGIPWNCGIVELWNSRELWNCGLWIVDSRIVEGNSENFVQCSLEFCFEFLSDECYACYLDAFRRH